MNEKRVYIAIDLKSFYASVECRARGLDPLTTNLVVADAARTDKTICLAVTPSLKAHGISGRPRLFEVVQSVEKLNKERLGKIKPKSFIGSSYDSEDLIRNPNLKLDYIIAQPRMAEYFRESLKIYNIYLQYFAKEDVWAYSIDEVFIDATKALKLYKLNAHDLAIRIIREILKEVGITATVGIGSNMYLAKVAMDIVAKHVPADADGVRIAELDELSYRRLLWCHKPLADFWRIGPGYVRRLQQHGLETMGDIARCSLGSKHSYFNEQLLYKMFGVNAEFLIDHAWGYEPCTIAEVKNYVPEANCLTTGQVLPRPYQYTEGMLIVKEMIDLLVLDLVAKDMVTNGLVLHISYDIENIAWKQYQGEIVIDRYGRKKPVPAHGTIKLGKYSASTLLLTEKVLELYKNIVDHRLLLRKVNITAINVISKKSLKAQVDYEQLNLFEDASMLQLAREQERARAAKEYDWQRVILKVKDRYGKNAILKGFNYLEGATTRERNEQLGGHKA